jgi:hypothetical protein
MPVRANPRVLALLLLVAGLMACVEVDGQRICISYDARADVLRLLLFYDGIHDSKDEPENCRRDLNAFVAGGDVMLLDWCQHLDMAKVRADARAEETPPAQRAFLAGLADSVRARPLGHFRDPDGSIGVAQYVEVLHASDLVKKANAAISESVLSAETADSAWTRTLERMRPWAREGRQWITLEGHSVAFCFPAHLPEWARNKTRTVLDAAHGSEAKEDKVGDLPDAWLRILSWSPVSVIETQAAVTVRLGDPARPNIFRARMRDRKSRNLDDDVVRLVPASFDALLTGDAPPAAGHPEDPGIRAILDWGPPEERARVLMARAAGASGEEKAAALARLAAWGEVWNRDVGVPKAPGVSADPVAVLDAWKAWYRELLGASPPK